jgi:uncharacterized protein
VDTISPEEQGDPASDPERQGSSLATEKSWTVLATLGFGLLIFISFIVVQNVSVWFFGYTLALFDPGIDWGMSLAVGAGTSGILCTALVLLVVFLRTPQVARSFLALKSVSLRTMTAWIGLAVVIVYAGDQLTSLLGRPNVPEVIVQAYLTALYVPLFWFSIVIGAPLFEEIFFRGFLFAGLSRSGLGVIGTALVTTLFWTIIHSQYDSFELSLVFGLGLFLVLARIRTGSLYVSFALHAVMNLIAVIQAMLEVASRNSG